MFYNLGARWERKSGTEHHKYVTVQMKSKMTSIFPTRQPSKYNSDEYNRGRQKKANLKINTAEISWNSQ